MTGNNRAADRSFHQVFIVGYGYVGRRVAELWLERGVPVSAMVRNRQKIDESGRDDRVRHIYGDLGLAETLKGQPTRGALVYYLAPPPGEGNEDPLLAAFLESVDGNRLPAALVYISTTGVYGDCGGEWVNEDRPPAPLTERGKRRLHAERALLGWSQRLTVPVVILRVSGIYGPGRLPLQRIQKGVPVVRDEDSSWSNRIHVDDLARVCVAAALRGGPGEIYNVSDGHPGTMGQYYRAVARTAGLPLPPEISMEEAERTLGSMTLSFLAQNRRIDNAKMLADLDLELLYPNVEEGVRVSLLYQ